MAKNTAKKMKDVCAGDVLYTIRKDAPTKGISEKVVEETGISYSGEKYFRFADEIGNNHIPKSSMSKPSISLYDGYVATSREELLKVAEKNIRKCMENTEKAIEDALATLNYMKERKTILSSLIEEIEEVK